MTHICVNEISHHCFRYWLVASSAPSHYLNQYWLLVNSTLRSILQWLFNWNSIISIHDNGFENVVCKMSAILPRPQCVETCMQSRAPVSWNEYSDMYIIVYRHHFSHVCVQIRHIYYWTHTPYPVLLNRTNTIINLSQVLYIKLWGAQGNVYVTNMVPVLTLVAQRAVKFMVA